MPLIPTDSELVQKKENQEFGSRVFPVVFSRKHPSERALIEINLEPFEIDHWAKKAEMTTKVGLHALLKLCIRIISAVNLSEIRPGSNNMFTCDLDTLILSALAKQTSTRLGQRK